MSVHPVAWWLWAISLAAAASLTTNPVLLALIACAASAVVFARRTLAPWAMGFRLYLYMGLAIIAIRVAYRVIFAAADGGLVLFTLPQLSWHVGSAPLTLFGAVSAQGLLGGLFDGVRLATMVLCVGAANSLANPKRILAAMPGALHEVSTAVVVALSVFPQLAESATRVSRARRLRGGSARRVHVIREVLMPVLADCLDRSLWLAASMDSRGFGRRGAVPRARRLATGALMIGGIVAIAVGVFGMLDQGAPLWLRLPMLAAGIACAFGALFLAGRAVSRTRYRPDKWTGTSTLYALCGLAAPLAIAWASTQPSSGLAPSLFPLTMPVLPLIPALGVLIAALPAIVPLPAPLREVAA